MKPTLLQAYEKCRRIIDTMTPKSIRASRQCISLFSRMFIYNNVMNDRTHENASLYRKDLLNRFSLKLDELFKENK
jgi:hypothetical protein